MPKPITNNTLFYGKNLCGTARFRRPVLHEYFSDIMPKSVPGQFKQAEKVRKKEGKQGELGI